jgi:hypothetical protein
LGFGKWALREQITLKIKESKPIEVKAKRWKTEERRNIFVMSSMPNIFRFPIGKLK